MPTTTTERPSVGGPPPERTRATSGYQSSTFRVGLPITRALTLSYALSIVVAVLLAVVSAVGHAFFVRGAVGHPQTRSPLVAGSDGQP